MTPGPTISFYRSAGRGVKQAAQISDGEANIPQESVFWNRLHPPRYEGEFDADAARLSPSAATSSRTSRATPTTMKLSARLKSGHE